jgi:UDP-3-O-[3-hydroxymyristoyl] glucosamine N-acyltransferase
VRELCHIGNDCIIHPNATIGADGFSLNCPERGLVKFRKLGNVIIGSKLEIGANSCVDEENSVLPFLVMAVKLTI